jgi:hypothetical protein
VIQLGAGLTASGLAVSASASGDLTLDFGSGDTITIQGGLKFTPEVVLGIQAISFADGTRLTYAQLLEKADTGSPGNLTLYGDGNGDSFDPAGYAHSIVSSGGGDSISYNAGDGALTISETAESGSAENIIKFGPGISRSELTIAADGAGNIVLSIGNGDEITILNALNWVSASGSVSGIQSLVFADGTTLDYADLLSAVTQPLNGATALYGDAGAQTFDPLGVVHSIIGGGGPDTIIFNRGYGELSLSEADRSGSGSAVLRLGAGITASQIGLAANSDGDLILSLGQGDQITIGKQLTSSSGVTYGVAQVEFADGTLWSAAELANYAQGSIPVGAGSESVLVDEGKAPGQTPLALIQFAASSTSVTVTMGDDLNSLVLVSGDGSTLTIGDIHATTIGNQSVVQFADGLSWNLAQLLSRVSGVSNVSGIVQGTSADETFDFSSIPANSSGYKLVEGAGGNDVFTYGLGDGAVEILQSDANLQESASSSSVQGSQLPC